MANLFPEMKFDITKVSVMATSRILTATYCQERISVDLDRTVTVYDLSDLKTLRGPTNFDWEKLHRSSSRERREMLGLNREGETLLK
jgi:hypothetical protein